MRHIPVFDDTGLDRQVFDFTVSLTDGERSDPVAVDRALHAQLGLRLVKDRRPVEFVDILPANPD